MPHIECFSLPLPSHTCKGGGAAKSCDLHLFGFSSSQVRPRLMRPTAGFEAVVRVSTILTRNVSLTIMKARILVIIVSGGGNPPSVTDRVLEVIISRPFLANARRVVECKDEGGRYQLFWESIALSCLLSLLFLSHWSLLARKADASNSKEQGASNARLALADTPTSLFKPQGGQLTFSPPISLFSSMARYVDTTSSPHSPGDMASHFPS